MATLVLSTVGNVLGGPVGGAIGALIGQSIDQQILGPGPRRGPRLNDLTVQTSSYGTQIPRLYGTMRAAGSVIWATDLKESSAVQSGGKGQAGTQTFTYSVSLAVALSSRAASGIGRIWADGKLVRGAAGDFKVRTEFRFYGGDEDQAVDPLIGSIETLALTPAYRGLAIAVFENLDLAEFGNRIPFLTFEVVGDSEPPTVGGLLADASGGVVQSTDPRPIAGYAAYGSSRRAAIEQLVDQLDVTLRDEGDHLALPGAVSSLVEDDELGCGDGRTEHGRLERSLAPERATASALLISYYDPARDFQSGSLRASAGARNGPELAIDMPLVLSAEQARSLAEDGLARRWAQRESVTVRLPQHYLSLRPGDEIVLPGEARRWIARKLSFDALVAIAELYPAWQGSPALAADPGRPAPVTDEVAGPTRLALFDLPDIGTGPVTQLRLAAASSTGRWRPVPVEIEVGGTISSATCVAQSVLGQAMTVLAPSQSVILDLISSVEVELANGALWLEGRDDQALRQGANLAMLGREVIQFGQASAIGPRRFRLSRLLRGRFGSEWAMGDHIVGDPFALIDPATLVAIDVPDALLGTSVSVTAYGLGDGGGNAASALATGEALRPPSPVHLRATVVGGEIEVTWVRRSRLGYAWLDEVDAPLGENAERYRVRIQAGSAAVEKDASVSSATFTAAELAPLGTGPATVMVCQVGDRALSRWSSQSIIL